MWPTCPRPPPRRPPLPTCPLPLAWPTWRTPSSSRCVPRPEGGGGGGGRAVLRRVGSPLPSLPPARVAQTGFDGILGLGLDGLAHVSQRSPLDVLQLQVRPLMMGGGGGGCVVAHQARRIAPGLHPRPQAGLNPVVSLALASSLPACPPQLLLGGYGACVLRGGVGGGGCTCTCQSRHAAVRPSAQLPPARIPALAGRTGSRSCSR
jgi:hypothetical protein